jgi:hypothetical protein
MDSSAQQIWSEDSVFVTLVFLREYDENKWCYTNRIERTDWISMSQNRDQWRNFMSTAMNL